MNKRTTEIHQKTREKVMKAWNSFSESQSADEKKYLDIILDFHHLGVLFKDKKNNFDPCNKDLIYGYCNEEDIRLKLASELYKFEDCQVHGQVHIHGRKNKNSNNHKSSKKHIHQYPDLLFIVFKKKHRTSTQENNLESTAIELKYFDHNSGGKNIRRSIINDLNKLISYQKKRLNPKTDNGYFFCIDESGKAKNIFSHLMNKKQYKRLHLDGKVLTPKYVEERLTDPGHLEHFNRGKDRRVAYLVDYVVGRICKKRRGDSPERLSTGEVRSVFCRSCLYDCNLPCSWLEIIDSNRLKGKQKKNELAVMIKLRLNERHLLPKHQRYHEKRFTLTNNPKSLVLFKKINLNKLSNINSIKQQGREIANKLKKLSH